MSQPVLNYMPILIFLLIAAPIGVSMLLLGIVVRPNRPNAAKQLPYECGNLPVGDARIQIRSRYYLFAMLLVLFDVEVVFLFPWAVNLKYFISRSMGLFVFVEMMIFLAILLLGYVYLWRNGGLEWD